MCLAINKVLMTTGRMSLPVSLRHAQEERQSFTERYTDAGFVDAFRAQHPGVVAYTYFSHRLGMRAKGKGWRLDYYLVSCSGPSGFRVYSL